MILAKPALLVLAVVAMNVVAAARPTSTDALVDAGAAPASTVGPPVIGGLTSISVTHDLQTMGLSCDHARAAAGGFVVRECVAAGPSGVYRASATTDAAGSVHTLVAAVSPREARLEPDKARAFLGLVATLPDVGAEPGSAVRWVGANVGRAGVSASFGASLLRLDVRGEPASYVLTVTAAPGAPRTRGARLL